MSIPEDIYDLLDTATTAPVSPFVRSHGTDFPCVVYRFDGDSFEGSRYGAAGVRRADVTAHCLARTLDAAEDLAEEIRASIVLDDCVRVTRVDREYDPSYDGQRSGIFNVSLSFSLFKG